VPLLVLTVLSIASDKLIRSHAIAVDRRETGGLWDSMNVAAEIKGRVKPQDDHMAKPPVVWSDDYGSEI
jgi:hypothetical protein